MAPLVFVLRPSPQGQKICRRVLKGLGLAVTEASPDSERASGHTVFMGAGLIERYRDLAHRFPTSRFILLVPRPLESAMGHAGSERDTSEGLVALGQEVEAFFADQPERLLTVQLPSQEGRVALKRFLQLPEPQVSPSPGSDLATRRLRRQRRERARTKVFCIGFHKTGTTSLERALEYLGYRVIGRRRLSRARSLEELFASCCELVPRYNAFQDNPWPIFFKDLDARYPGSKFILTVRSPDEWLRSQLKHFGAKSSQMRQLIYGVGSPLGHEDIYRDRFNQHNQEVLEYFHDRPSDLLVLDLTAGDGWEKLCPFLGHSIPDVPFPRSNTAQDRLQREQLQSRSLSRRGSEA
ncbi:conserved hypothetical protein [Cyanobium sp. PCC 7001]|uniref:sulfotransferase family protein n=1 Tax=Cyanobium sp. PCC 7001 TaxID=180281 RepID=UPI000180599A|nr:sulfotransferase family protein [Cyanobium sp. PCC 7001]EDY38722.1 conserved hypothetical protein [Cyanobium sp. PCC 7001]